MATKTGNRKTSAISANVQWAALAAVAVLGVIAVFVFGIGNTNEPGGGHSGAPASISISAS